GTVLIAEDQVRERLAVTRGAAVVDHERRPAAGGVRLCGVVERRSLLAVRAAVDGNDERMARTGLAAEWNREERLDLHAVETDERERLYRCNVPLRKQRFVQRGEPPRTTALEHLELRDVARTGERVCDHVRSAERPVADTPGARHDFLDFTAADGHACELDAAAVLEREVDPSTVRRPLGRALAPVERVPQVAQVGAVRV